jgi:ABC-type uncharacterized transport system substrate-binding protein
MQFDQLKRREFITLLGGAAAAWPFAAQAQQGERVRRVGILVVQAERDAQVQSNVAMFQRRLAELGWVEDRNTRFEQRYADGDPERMRTNTAEIVRLKPDVILAQNTPMVAVLRQQTTTIPIVLYIDGHFAEGVHKRVIVVGDWSNARAILHSSGPQGAGAAIRRFIPRWSAPGTALPDHD